MAHRARRIGICSWSLRASTPDHLVAEVRACGLGAVQLALDPLRRGDWSIERTTAALAAAGIDVLSGMMSTRGEDYSTLVSIRETGGVRPDVHWEANREAARENATLAARLGVGLVSFHAGFLPESPDDPEHGKLVERLRTVVDLFSAEGVRVAFETGQETAPTLLAFLDALERPQAGVNFDPANMLLYGMGDPVQALRELAPRVAQVHVKDARRSPVAGEWGEEVPVGTGEVDWPAFFGVLTERDVACDLVIEREAGEQRVADVRTAAELVRKLAPEPRP